LLIGWIYSVFVGFLLFHALQGIIYYVNCQQGTALSSPSLKGKGSSRAALIKQIACEVYLKSPHKQGNPVWGTGIRERSPLPGAGNPSKILFFFVRLRRRQVMRDCQLLTLTGFFPRDILIPNEMIRKEF
jgi:hypothetical protein